MLCYKRREDIQRFLKIVKGEGKKVGFVPTMGALHQGHINLIARSKLENDITVCSIFINPTQFNQQDDFEKYPISTAADLLLLSDVGCDLVFLPAVEDIYPSGIGNKNQIDLGQLGTIWEGAHRPGHFDGVAQVVEILLDIVSPNNLYMGQKDLQQVMVVNQLIEQKKHPTQLVICPTTRESDGLAMSSRNVRLNSEDRKHAAVLSATLFYMQANFHVKPHHELVEEGRQKIMQTPNVRLEYLSIVTAHDLMPLSENKEGIQAVAIVAAWVGNVRLIDNIYL
jgi:pantoate--beta-alanine ligase